jgi:hypothetical protein
MRRQIDIHALRGIGAVGDVWVQSDALRQLGSSTGTEQQQRYADADQDFGHAERSAGGLDASLHGEV